MWEMKIQATTERNTHISTADTVAKTFECRVWLRSVRKYQNGDRNIISTSSVLTVEYWRFRTTCIVCIWSQKCAACGRYALLPQISRFCNAGDQ